MKTAMERATVLAFAPTLNLVRKQGVAGFVNGTVVLPLVGILILGGLYQTLDGEPLDARAFSVWYPYFVGFSAFTAGAASWEIELLSGVRAPFAGRSGAAVLSRVGYVLVALAPVTTVLLLVRVAVAPATAAQDALCCLLISVGCSVLGCGVAQRLGFGGDKGVNNVVQMTPWVFALGPSPFLGDGLGLVAWVFPGAPAPGAVVAEAVRAVVYVVVGVVLIRTATGAERRPAYIP